MRRATINGIRVDRLVSTDGPVFCAIDPPILYRPDGRGSWMVVPASNMSETATAIATSDTISKPTDPDPKNGWTVVFGKTDTGWTAGPASTKFGALEAVIETRTVDRLYTAGRLTSIQLTAAIATEFASSAIPKTIPPSSVTQTMARIRSKDVPGAVSDLQIQTIPAGFRFRLSKPDDDGAGDPFGMAVWTTAITVGQVVVDVRLLLNESYRYRYLLAMRDDLLPILPFISEPALWKIIAEYQLLSSS